MSGLLLRDPRNPTYGLLHSRLQQETTDAELQLVTVVPSVAQRAEFEPELDLCSGFRGFGHVSRLVSRIWASGSGH